MGGKMCIVLGMRGRLNSLAILFTLVARATAFSINFSNAAFIDFAIWTRS